MVGIDRETGKTLSGFADVAQKIFTICWTPIGVRVQREEFGSLIPKILLRENIDNRAFAIYYWCFCVAVELWEPRFKIKKLIPKDTVEKRRVGTLDVYAVGDYMPRAHLGDFTVAEAGKRLDLSS